MQPIDALLLIALLSALVLVMRPALADERAVPDLPAPEAPIRLLIDSDAACEIDDLYGIGLALVSQDRFQIEGFVGAHFGDAGGPTGIADSVSLIEDVLRAAGMAGDFPVKPGAPPFQYSAVPPEGEGVDLIIERAMAADARPPLWIVSLGACTNTAAAWLKEPAIADRVIVLWHGRTQWPERCWNFNAYNDLKAARILFTSDLPLILFDTGTYLRAPMAETEQNLRPHGELGRFLHDFRLRNIHFQSPLKGFFDLGDVAALVDPEIVYSEVVDAPEVDWDMRYIHNHRHGKIRRIYQIDRDQTFTMLYERMKRYAR